MTTTTGLEQVIQEMRELPGADSRAPQLVNPGTEVGTGDWSAPLQARIVRPLYSAPDERHQVRLPAGSCDIQWAADLALLSWWGRGKVRQITIPGPELDRLFAAGLIEWD